MVKIGLGVPVYKNFEGFTRLMASVDVELTPFIVPNYDDNIGVSRGWNQCFDRALAAGVDNLIISNDDIVFEPGSIQTLIDNFHPDDDLITMTNTRDGVSGTGWSDSADFSCFLVCPQRFVPKLGAFDENFSPAYFEDNDMAYRINLSGGRYRQILDARMYHAGSVTQNFNGIPVVTGQMFEANRNYYNLKWGGNPTEEKFSTPFNDPTKKVSDW